jgi:hypothetical protein
VTLLDQYPPMDWWSDESKRAYIASASALQKELDEFAEMVERCVARRHARASADPIQGKLQLEVA